jgi:hypothetical protein
VTKVSSGMTTQTPFVRIASACGGHCSMKVTSRPARTRSGDAGSVRARADDGDLLALHADAFPGAPAKRFQRMRLV